ncbi:hypothetical protein [Streptomyces sp. NPDC018693]|uniref:hypothetical protein n=1 Tax=unclassified Streptomyces TaxID=2593676 RepID=UPI0037907E59
MDDVVPDPGRPPTRLYGFAGGTEGWSGCLTKAGTWPVTEWVGEGARSLKADVEPGGRRATSGFLLVKSGPDRTGGRRHARRHLVDRRYRGGVQT